MGYNIYFAPSAEQDYREIYQFYRNIGASLGNRFNDAVDDRLRRLAITQLAGTIRYENIRCTLIKKFPYLIHYTVDETQKSIIVLRIFHTAQKPLWDI